MNNQRRKLLQNALAKLGEATTLLEIARDEEQDAFDNLSEGLQQSERGQAIEEAASNLATIVDDLEALVSSVEAAAQ